MATRDAALEGSRRTPRQHTVAAVVLVSAIAFSSGPVLIHLTSKDSNPFYFNIFVVVARLFLLMLFLMWTKKRFLYALPRKSKDEDGGTVSGFEPSRLLSPALHLSYFKRDSPDDADGGTVTTIASVDVGSPSQWIRMPLLWVVVSSFQIGLLVWAAQYVETAIASTIYELWPAFVVYGLARHDVTDARYLNRSNRSQASTLTKTALPKEHIALTGIAVVGIVFMLGSQAGDSFSSWTEVLSFEATVGIILALIAAFIASLTVVGSIAYGRIIFYQLVDETAKKDHRRLEPISDRGPESRKLLLWLTLFGVFIAGLVSIPISLTVALVMPGHYTGISATGVKGAMLMGLCYISGVVLLRIGNIAAAGPGVNALVFLSPLLALTWLMIAGVSLPRFDLFIIGAALILAINILIQLKPDQQRSISDFNKDDLPGYRLGFTAFILSIWTFGTVVYLRDDVMPSAWLDWPITGDYWGLIALSATIFALILGFRMARLTTRISHEDEMMFGLFRDCEHLTRRGVFQDGIVGKLADLDTAQTRKLLKTYNEVRQDVRSATAGVEDRDDEQLLVSIEAQLDRLAHSKQQGRDIVELLSLTAFAAVTVGLGLFARPVALDAGDASWSGFLSEVFILLFVSTVSFLCVNLFDIRRERETPLLVSVKNLDGDYGLFFRYRRNLTVQHATAVAISLVMSCVFCVLLFHKWL